MYYVGCEPVHGIWLGNDRELISPENFSSLNFKFPGLSPKSPQKEVFS